jgi:hypothetical protein
VQFFSVIPAKAGIHCFLLRKKLYGVIINKSRRIDIFAENCLGLANPKQSLRIILNEFVKEVKEEFESLPKELQHSDLSFFSVIPAKAGIYCVPARRNDRQLRKIAHSV